jgi:SOS-response transcriptional repressor LexA
MKDKKQEILEFIQIYKTENGRSPSYQQIAEGTTLKSKQLVSYHLKQLEQMGLITRNPKSARAVEVVVS